MTGLWVGLGWLQQMQLTDCSVNNLTVINNEAFHSGVCVNGIDKAQKSV